MNKSNPLTGKGSVKPRKIKVLPVFFELTITARGGKIMKNGNRKSILGFRAED